MDRRWRLLFSVAVFNLYRAFFAKRGWSYWIWRKNRLFSKKTKRNVCVQIQNSIVEKTIPDSCALDVTQIKPSLCLGCILLWLKQLFQTKIAAAPLQRFEIRKVLRKKFAFKNRATESFQSFESLCIIDGGKKCFARSMKLQMRPVLPVECACNDLPLVDGNKLSTTTNYWYRSLKVWLKQQFRIEQKTRLELCEI